LRWASLKYYAIAIQTIKSIPKHTKQHLEPASQRDSKLFSLGPVVSGQNLVPPPSISKLATDVPLLFKIELEIFTKVESER
jgi:hypothetical protein